MSVPNPFSPQDPVNDRASHEPSMEEILASIRRIISDDQSLASHRDHSERDLHSASLHGLPSGANQAPQSRETVSDTASAADPREAARAVPPMTSISVDKRVASAPVSSTAAITERPRSEALFRSMPEDQRPLELRPAAPRHSEFADMRLRQRFDEEAESVSPGPPHRAEPEPALNQKQEPLISPATDAAVATSFNALFASRLLPNPDVLAEMTRDLLRPMLKAWLDDNLPVLVERLVRAEIERVARGGR